MIQHWFKIIWNRKKQNFLLILEIFVAFLVVCLLFVQGTQMYNNYQRPLGFSYDKVWAISFDNKAEPNDWMKANNTERFHNLLAAIQAKPEVETVAGTNILPFTYNNWTNGDSIPGESINLERTLVTDGYLETMGIELVDGEWFNSSHDALNYTPAIITEALAKKYFGNESPIGRRIAPVLDEGLKKRHLDGVAKGEWQEERVVGVIRDYRKYGLLNAPINFSFRRTAPADTIMSMMPHNIVVRVNSDGMLGSFEEQVLKTLESMEPNWTFTMKPLKEYRDLRFRRTITPLISFALIAGFLLLMVALGLTGVVWQNITARRPEIGLRRALGAAQESIFQQIIGELLVLSSISLLLGSIVAWQFPLMDFIIVRNIPMNIYFIGWLAAVIFIYLLTIACGTYPSLMATRVSPTEALHDE